MASTSGEPSESLPVHSDSWPVHSLPHEEADVDDGQIGGYMEDTDGDGGSDVEGEGCGKEVLGGRQGREGEEEGVGLFLWAAELGFQHPTSNQDLVLTAPPPPRFAQFLELHRRARMDRRQTGAGPAEQV